MTAPSPAISDEPPLSTDFAARVMRRAEQERARRRFRRLGLSGIGALLIGAALLSALRMAMAPEAPHRVAEATRRTETEVAWRWSARQTDAAGALVYLFPNAPPLMGFVNRYSAATYGISLDEEPDPVSSIEGSGTGL